MLGLDPVVRAYVSWAVKRHGRLDVAVIREIWPIVVGKTWARRTRVAGLAGERLDVVVPDSVWQQELRYQNQRILARLNALLPETLKPFSVLRLSVGPGFEEGSVARVGSGPIPEPLSPQLESAVAEIDDPELRALVTRVVSRDKGRRAKGGPANAVASSAGVSELDFRDAASGDEER